MRVWCRSYWTPKASCTDKDYEDAFAWWPRGQLEGVRGERFRFAAADGASASSYSRLWARQLVRGFVTDRLQKGTLAEALLALREGWVRGVRRAQRGRPLPWYAEEKLGKGAFAALVGLELIDEGAEEPDRWKWRAFAVGDSCLVHMRERKVELTFPIDRADLFGVNPVLLSTDTAGNAVALRESKHVEGSGIAGDRFYLMTDALAQWFLRQVEESREPWIPLQDFDRDPAAPVFRDWVTGLRDSGQMRNDDVTLLRIEVER